MVVDNVSAIDEKYIWHPFTQAKTSDAPIAIKRADGAFIFDFDDKQYIDLISSWWTNLHGHCQPQIARAIYEQALNLEHVIFGGFTHKPATTLCENLVKFLPTSLRRFFFSDNGSTAVEVALKMAHQYWKNVDQYHRKIFISFEGGYHGDTFGAMALGNSSGFHNQFSDLLFKVKHIPFPHTWEGDADVLTKENKALLLLEQYLTQHGDEVVAMLAEPLIQGAAGMRICRPSFMNQVMKLLQNHGILIILDEVMTGFGRTGTIFALDQLEIVPDIICLSKGLTGGFLPLSLTVVGDHIYNAFLSDDFRKTFLHGHSYTANPLGCAAAIASLELLTSKRTEQQIKLINKIHLERMQEFHHPSVVAKRVIGTIAAFNIGNVENNYNYNNGNLKQQFLQQGLLLRPLGNTVYFLPPYCITEKDLDQSYDKVQAIIKKLFS